MKTLIQKSRVPSWLLCLALAAILQLGALPQTAAAGQTLASIPPAIRVQYPYNMSPPDTYAPYDFAPNDVSPDQQWPYSDSNIRREVRHLFVVDTFLDAINIRLQVQDGVVMLTGRVKTWENRSRAETDAYAAGARSVVNVLKVLPY